MGNCFNLTKSPGTLKVAVFGDVHLGNRRTLTPDVLRGLRSFFPKNTETKALDLIIIEGDLFDEGLMFYHDYLGMIQNWMLELIVLCHRNKIALRVLEGTPSHDMHQSRQFLTLIEATQLEIDFRYVEDLEIEQHPTLGDILYVPDEWGSSCEHCYSAAKALLADHGLKRVDYCIFHGAFEYQLPAHKGIPTHDSKAWQELVEYAIFAGHIHQYSKHGKIIASGSTDRYTHGDERAKGHVRAFLSPNGSKFTFVENKLAKVYITVDCRNLTPSEALEAIKPHLTLPKGSFIRIQYTKMDSLSTMKSYLRVEYPDLFWDDIVEDGGTAKLESKLLPETVHKTVHLNSGNLGQMLEARMVSFKVEGNEIAAALKELESICLDLN